MDRRGEGVGEDGGRGGGGRLTHRGAGPVCLGEWESVLRLLNGSLWQARECQSSSVKHFGENIMASAAIDGPRAVFFHPYLKFGDFASRVVPLPGSAA